jgi:hypothetical protein
MKKVETLRSAFPPLEIQPLSELPQRKWQTRPPAKVVVAKVISLVAGLHTEIMIQIGWTNVKAKRGVPGPAQYFPTT